MIKTNFADMHLHTTASDGTLSPSELVALAYESGISTIALTDHDTVGGIAEAKAALPSGMTLIPGVEFSCFFDTGEPFLLHILGYGIDPDASSINDVIRLGKRTRAHKHTKRLEYLKERYCISFTDEELEFFNTRPNVGKPHIAEVLRRRGMAWSIKEAIDTFMSSPDFPDGNIPASSAIRSIVESGGIPVYAHSLGGECDARLSYEQTQRRILLMKEAGILGLECYYSRYSREDEAFLLSVAKRLGLLVSGGSDFHGKNKTVVIGELSNEGQKIGCDKLSVLDKIR